MERPRSLSLVDGYLFCKRQTARVTGVRESQRERDKEREEQCGCVWVNRARELFLDEVTSIYLFNWGSHSG